MAADSIVLLGTRSTGKLRELHEILAEYDIRTITLDDAGIPPAPAEDLVEKYATFEENALAKARYFYDLTKMPVLADDSGIVVDALGGAPGVISKRYSGRSDLSGVALDMANNQKLLRELERVERESELRGEGQPLRSARYMCVAAYAGEQGELVREGSIEGRVITEARGNGGFGYDPHVEVHELNGTMAEAGWREKAKVSHRARAFRALLPALRELGWV
ncbi:MAG TPA: non-canonical purine NTP pyrophosphatase [Gemmatimonadaceae bacterium]|nr:non-canonical purine NTP pyrophosphatase [Gemmatimonadaceae bacterium]